MERLITLRRLGSILMSLIVLTSGLAIPTAGQERRPINIRFGQPNIWSLEQAHYLLARMRTRSLGIQGQPLTDADLNPNETTGTRLRQLKQSLGVGVGFDAQAGLKNELFAHDARFKQQRREQLLALRDQREGQLSEAARQLHALQLDRERMKIAEAGESELALKQMEIDQKTAEKSQFETQLTGINTELTGLTVATELPTPTVPTPQASPGVDSVLDKLLADDTFRDSIITNDIPELNASTKLDNYLDFQYEVIAKQLTLLRDEVGPGERLIFLELPQSLYTVPDKSNRKLAQVWWNIEGYYTKPEEVSRVPADNMNDPRHWNAYFGISKDCKKAIIAAENERTALKEAEFQRRKKAAPGEADEKIRQEIEVALAVRGDPDARGRGLICNPFSSVRPKSRLDMLQDIALQKYQAKVNTGEIRTIDLIPRQSAFNVNDIQDKQKNFNLAGLFTFLTGFGARVDFQRQRRLYEQFIVQDTYASAFGKGDSEFGWTFGPKPGTERIATGLHTTYAIIVVPEKAEAIKLSARGCHFPRTGYAPNSFGETNETELIEGASSRASLNHDIRCPASETFTLPIPGTTENNFWVTGVDYKSVRPGERAVVYVHGDYFSPQIGVLVDGVALRQTVGLAQVALAGAPQDNGFQPPPRGEFEFVNSKLIVLAFTMPRNSKGEEYKGTPSIALVTPGRAQVINNVRLVVNDSYKCTKDQAGGPVKPDTNCPCYVYDDLNIPEKDRTCKVYERYKRLPEPLGLDRKDSIYIELVDQPAIFSDLPKAASLEIGDLKILSTVGGVNTAYLTGSKFDLSDELRINGVKVEEDKCEKTVSKGVKPCTPEDLVAVAEGRGGNIKRTCKMGDVAVDCPDLLGKNLLRIQFKATNESVLDVTIVHREDGKDPQIASKQFRNDQLPRVDRVAIIEYRRKNKPALLKLFLEGSGFSSDMLVKPDPSGVVERHRRVSATTMSLDLELNEQIPLLRLDLGPNSAQQSTSVVVSLPVDPPEEEEEK